MSSKTYQYFDILERHAPGSGIFELVCTDDHMQQRDLDTYIQHLRQHYKMTKRYDRVANITYYVDQLDDTPLFAVRQLH